MPKPIHDRGYKRLFENVHFFQQLLESFVGKSWVKALDFTQCESIKKSYVSDEYKESTKDLLYKIKHKDKDLYIVILLEFQSTIPFFMVIRVFHYIASFYLDLTEQNPALEKLPPVFPIVLYNGKEKWDAPTNIAEVIEEGHLMEECGLAFRFFNIAVNAYTPDRLQALNNLVSTLFLGDAHYDLETLKAAFEHLLDHHLDQEDVLQLFHWFLHLAVRDIRPMSDYEELRKIIHDKTRVLNMLEDALEADRREGFEQGMAQGMTQGMTQGKAEGIAEGKAITLTKIAKKMLDKNFAVADIAQCTGLNESEILKLQQDMAKH